MKTVGKTLAFLIVVLLSILTSFLQTYIVISISEMYKLAFITRLSFAQIFGFLIVYGLISYKNDASKSYDDTSDATNDGSLRATSYTVAYLLIWGMAYLIHLIVF